MKVAYNEIDPYAVDYLRWLMVGGLVEFGHVFTCSIEDLTPRDLQGFDQFHAFAGMGVWSYALRCARRPYRGRIWTGSCPCQPFSASGKGAGFADERHLWPAFFHLITNCRPERVVGEQVAGKDGLAWLDLVSSDMEAAGYAFRAVPLCSAGFGSPDIRNRLYWSGNDIAGGRCGPTDRPRLEGCDPRAVGHERTAAERTSCVGGMAFAHDAERWADTSRGDQRDGPNTGRPQGASDAEGRGAIVGMADAGSGELRGRYEHGAYSGAARRVRDKIREQWVRADDSTDGPASGVADGEGIGRRAFSAREPGVLDGAEQSSRSGHPRRMAYANGGHEGDGDLQRSGEHGQFAEDGGASSSATLPGPLNGFWRDADWLRCRDGRWRPAEPGTFPLAHGAPARLGRLRTAGNAINAQVAIHFLEGLEDD